MSDYREAVEWAKRNLPDEHAPFVASAAMSLRTLGLPVTAEAVRKRLVAQGRDHEANAERERRYAAVEGRAA